MLSSAWAFRYALDWLHGRSGAPRARAHAHHGHPVGDTETLNKMDTEGVDCLLCMEIIDFTVSEYVRDSAMLGQGKCIIHMGHFNGEEPGMEYMATWVSRALEAAGLDSAKVPVSFVPMGDTYQYVLAC